MDAPFADRLLGWKRNKHKLIPNCADTDSAQSCRIAGTMLDHLGVPPGVPSLVPADPGRPLERYVEDYLANELFRLAPQRQWCIYKESKAISDFIQYEHLQKIDQIVKEHPELRVTLGRDYLIRPDVVVGLAEPGVSLPFLHAVVSCKWTIRSDRVQNIRHENNQMIRHRRGRQPHLITVTAEPLPTRLVSIARGTGEVDAVYHIAFEALARAVEAAANADQRDAWDECVQQKRLLPFADLAPTLVRW